MEYCERFCSTKQYRHCYAELMEQTSINCALLLLLLLLSMSVQSRRISCTSSGSVNEGESALVTCDYHTNLREHRRGFYIYKYPVSGEDPDVPAICKWEEDFLRCDIVDGYGVRVDGHRMALSISSAQQVHAGRYVCHILQPENDIQVEECNLIVKKKHKGVKINCHAIVYPLHGQQTTIICFVSDSLNASTIVLKRHAPSESNAAEELISCNGNTDMCSTRGFGYQISLQESASLGYRVIILLVEKPGRYVCTAEGDYIQTQTCALDVEKDIKTDTLKETSPQHQGTAAYALTGVAVFLLVAVVVAFVYYIRTFRTRNVNEPAVDGQATALGGVSPPGNPQEESPAGDQAVELTLMNTNVCDI